ncbi:MAG: class I SAM-dependent methyltransferase [Verrucomicrobiota bacterium]
MNQLEFLLMNNPVRAFIQRHFEGPRLERMGGVMAGGCALEIGCGRGVGVQIILDRFGATRVDAVDLDPKMIRRAQKRLKGRPARLWVADATDLGVDDSSYDAAFDFGIIHHIPDWRKALGEVWRALKPGGRFYAEEALRDIIARRLCRALFGHPWEDRFDHSQFIAGLRQAGFQVVATRQIWNRFGWYVAQKGTHAKDGHP